MKYRLLGRTGMYVSEICLGTMTYGGKGFWIAIGQMPQDAVNTHVKMAWDAGVNFFDTANVYSYGESERLFGQAIKDTGIPRHELVIATKVRARMANGPNNVGLSRKHILHEVDQSLERLGTDYIDLYLIHGEDPLTPPEETLSALNDVVRAGKVRYIGASNHSAWQLMKALAISDKQGWSRFECLQAYYSMVGRDVEREVIPCVLDQDVGIMVWSPLAGGFLTGKYRRETSGPDDARRTNFDFPPINKELAYDLVETMDEIARAHDASVAQIAQKWVLDRPGVTCINIGATKDEQLKQNLAIVDIELSDDEKAVLDEASKLAPEYPNWMIQIQAGDRAFDAKLPG